MNTTAIAYGQKIDKSLRILVSCNSSCVHKLQKITSTVVAVLIPVPGCTGGKGSKSVMQNLHDLGAVFEYHTWVSDHASLCPNGRVFAGFMTRGSLDVPHRHPPGDVIYYIIYRGPPPLLPSSLPLLPPSSVLKASIAPDRLPQ